MFVDGVETRVMMHRMIFGASADVQLDHHDGDGLNNRRKNLRVATQRQNNQNRRLRPLKPCSSKWKGVFWDGIAKKWRACIRAGEIGADGARKKIYLGSFFTEEEAAGAYDRAAIAHFGEFAALNSAPKVPRTVRSVPGRRILKRSKKQANGEYRGVRRSGKRWIAAIHPKGKYTRIGTFDTAEEAARAWDIAALAYFGDVGEALNFPHLSGGNSDRAQRQG